MDLLEDEPRQQPTPMPFCQKALLQPVVPEVSLLLQENTKNQLENKNDSGAGNGFSGTEFQTYNSWRWKNMNQNSNNNKKLNYSEATNLNLHTNKQSCYLFKDKYFTSDLEKRKNEILYGDLDEPRRPLPPRSNPVIPTSIEPFFSKTSYNDLKPVQLNQGKQQKALDDEYVPEEKTSGYTAFSKNFNKIENSEKLYNIISDQIKQMQVLQNQIDQLLRLQGIKDKQIEQLLNSQESKEKKIDQLIQSLDCKGKEVSQLLDLKEKQEQHLQELLRSNEIKQKENLSLIRKLSELKQKENRTVGVMANVQLADASTCTTLDNDNKESSSKKAEAEHFVEEEISYLRDSSRLDEKEKSISLHSSDLPVIQENVPTPQSSIQLDIQDFPDSSDGSEIEVETPCNSPSTANGNQSRPLGYTFYNNVLTQLKSIIKNSKENENASKKNQISENSNHIISKPDTKNNFFIESKDAAGSFHRFNVFDNENVPTDSQEQKRNKRISEKSSKLCLKDACSPSDISLKINALALKYLKQEQISQSQIPTSCQHDVTIYNVTNLSFGSMRYLDRYKMLPNSEENQKQIDNQINDCCPFEFLHGKTRMTVQQNIKTSIGNILDISTLNQQPKLL